MRTDPMTLLALQDLGARYWAYADGDSEVAIGELFTEDAVLVLGSLTLDGRAAIVRFFEDRRATQLAAQRTTRHIACNYRVALLADHRARVQSTVLVYVGTGPLPLPSGAPAGIADFDDVCIQDDSGGWRFSRREGRSIFVGPGAASFAR